MPSNATSAVCITEPGIAAQRTDQMSSTEIFKPDAEHQQDDADLRKLQRQVEVGLITGVRGQRRRPRSDSRRLVRA